MRESSFMQAVEALGQALLRASCLDRAALARWLFLTQAVEALGQALLRASCLVRAALARLSHCTGV
jgi:hypothetical protein